MPAHIAPYKSAAEDPGPEQRLRMCELAAEPAPGLAVCRLELAREPPSYTVESLSAIHASHPAARLTFILGADTACTIPSWCEPARLIELADLAVAERSGASREQVLRALSELLAGAAGDREPGERVRFLGMAPVEISSSAVRAAAARGEPIAELVGAPVAGYIEQHGLYRDGERAA